MPADARSEEFDGSTLTDEPSDGHGARCVTLTGEIDVANGEHLRDALSEILRESNTQRMAVDLAGVTFLDSSGLGALLAAKHEADSIAIRSDVTATSSAVARAIEIAGLTEFLNVARSRQSPR